MESITKSYHYYFTEIADKRVENWPLMSSPIYPLMVIAIYLYAIYKYLPEYMENRKPYNLKKIIQLYNILQVFSCITLLHGLITSGWTTNFSLGCWPVDYSNEDLPLKMLQFMWWTFILKGVELIETVFFILRKKYNQVSKLHVYHHSSTFMIGWIGTKYIGGGMVTFPVIINLFIHVLMYTYYFLSTLNPTIQKKIAHQKPKLTMLQMIQFCIILVHSLQVLSADCNISNLAVYMFFPNVVLIFSMFINFYIKSYNTKKCK